MVGLKRWFRGAQLTGLLFTALPLVTNCNSIKLDQRSETSTDKAKSSEGDLNITLPAASACPTPQVFQNCIDRLKTIPAFPPKEQPSIWDVITSHAELAGTDGCYLREQIVNSAIEKHCTPGTKWDHDKDSRTEPIDIGIPPSCIVQIWSVFPKYSGNWCYHTVPGCICSTDGTKTQCWVCETEKDAKALPVAEWGYCWYNSKDPKVFIGEPGTITQPPAGCGANVFIGDSDQSGWGDGNLSLEELLDRSRRWTECKQSCRKEAETKVNMFKWYADCVFFFCNWIIRY